MKKFIGLLILIIVLVAVSGCTQQAKTTPATTAIPTAVATVIATPVETSVAPTTEATAEVTPAETGVVANVTAPGENATVPAATQTVAPALTFSTVTTIHIANNTFSPATIMVLPGTGITWVNDDKVVHSVKMIGEHAGKFNSGDIANGGRWGYTFGADEGTFEYADGYNPNVTGVVIIKKGETLYGVKPVSTYMTSNATW
jgi:plastocyanin